MPNNARCYSSHKLSCANTISATVIMMKAMLVILVFVSAMKCPMSGLMHIIMKMRMWSKAIVCMTMTTIAAIHRVINE